jgi:hypothetical protein
MRIIGRILSGLIAYGTTPLFWLLAAANYDHGGHDMAMMGGLGSSPMRHDIFGVMLNHEIVSAVMSMWLMWVLMGLAHAGPWIALIFGNRAISNHH